MFVFCVQIFLDIANIGPTEFFLQRKYAMKGFYKEFTLSGLSVAMFELIKLVVLAKGTFKLPNSQQVRFLILIV